MFFNAYDFNFCLEKYFNQSQYMCKLSCTQLNPHVGLRNAFIYVQLRLLQKLLLNCFYSIERRLKLLFEEKLFIMSLLAIVPISLVSLYPIERQTHLWPTLIAFFKTIAASVMFPLSFISPWLCISIGAKNNSMISSFYVCKNNLNSFRKSNIQIHSWYKNRIHQ